MDTNTGFAQYSNQDAVHTTAALEASACRVHGSEVRPTLPYCFSIAETWCVSCCALRSAASERVTPSSTRLSLVDVATHTHTHAPHTQTPEDAKQDAVALLFLIFCCDVRVCVCVCVTVRVPGAFSCALLLVLWPVMVRLLLICISKRLLISSILTSNT